MAYRLAETLQLKHTFDHTKQMAGYDWLNSFLRRNPALSIRKSEGIAMHRSVGLNKESVENYFKLLEEIMTEHQLFDKPGNVYNVDESGLQLNNKPGQVIAVKGSKSVPTITSGEKGETISVVTCCNAEGSFLPPYCIMKGKYCKEEWKDGMPPGTVIKMSQKSAYANADIFFDWLQNHFVPRKPRDHATLLILDGHTSHCNSVEMLEYAEEQNIILLCLPSHTTHFLQPLDRSFFKSLKSYYYNACKNFMMNNPTKRINRLQFGKLLGEAWNSAAKYQNAVSGFRSTGIIPFNPDAIPDYAFLSEDVPPNPVPQTDSSGPHRPQTPQPACSKVTTPPSTKRSAEKLLIEISPIPLTSAMTTLKKRSRNVAVILNETNNITELKVKQLAKKQKIGKKATTEVTKPKTKGKQQLSKSKKIVVDSSSDSDEEVSVHDESDDEDQPNVDNICVGCGEDYRQTIKSDDWIQCITCERWLHESCTKYANFCDLCGKFACKI